MPEPHPNAAAARLSKKAIASAAGIDAAFIDRLVEQFYDKVRVDAMLGPVFASKVTDWAPHLARMKLFWSIILLSEGKFSGSPMALHIAIPDIGAFHFRRWLVLFEATLGEIDGTPEATALIIGRARTIADSLLTGIQVHRNGVRNPNLLKGVNHV